MQMPELRVPDLSRWTTIALVLVVAGIVTIVLGLLGGSDSSDAADGPKRAEPIEPVEAIDPADKDAGFKDSVKDLSDPFSTGFGDNVKHKVTVRVTANGPGGVTVRFRGGREKTRAFTGSYTETRTFKSQFPVAQVAFQIFPSSTRGSCSIVVDGVEVASDSTTSRYGLNEPFGVTLCIG